MIEQGKIEMNEINQSNNPPCKSCGSTHIRKYGTFEGVQRYFCKECKRKFVPNDALANTHTCTISTGKFVYGSTRIGRIG